MLHLFTSVTALLRLTSLVSAGPISASVSGSQLPDGLPNPSPSELEQIEQNAHGTLPNGPPPAVISEEGIVNLQLIAFNELFEVAFFNELLKNVTSEVEGYCFPDSTSRDFAIRSLKAILAVCGVVQS